jgi:hypothetical protein
MSTSATLGSRTATYQVPGLVKRACLSMYAQAVARTHTWAAQGQTLYTDAKTDVQTQRQRQDRQTCRRQMDRYEGRTLRRTNNGRKDVRQTSRRLAYRRINTLPVFDPVMNLWLYSLLCYTKDLIFYRVACGMVQVLMQPSVLNTQHSALGATQPRHSASHAPLLSRKRSCPPRPLSHGPVGPLSPSQLHTLLPQPLRHTSAHPARSAMVLLWGFLCLQMHLSSRSALTWPVASVWSRPDPHTGDHIDQLHHDVCAYLVSGTVICSALGWTLPSLGDWKGHSLLSDLCELKSRDTRQQYRQQYRQ